ncbi:unnamed protein product [Lactuca virosa]|uniref:Peptidase A1 domain-containing protein n=1 Tax=Lactuca virosa TaxID=75947 RepID=A0AAU9NAJ0_9ASTR|nr:unnamed protein product [Lactuca virosa]
MASSIFLASPILVVILFHLLLENGPTSCFATNPTGKPPPDLRLTLTRVDVAKSFPKNQFAPSSMSEANAAEITSPTQASNDLYVTKLAIGTPPVIFSAVVDTGSDLIWTKCDSSSRFYDSSKSKSFFKSKESCDSFGCTQEYADGESIKVSMGGEKLTIGGVSRGNITFACGTPNDKKSFNKYNGVVGMGRGKLSLVSQLNINVFSYCLASRSHKSEQSILLTGSNTKTAMRNVQTTPLLKQEDKSYYYITLEGISVGQTKLPISTSDFAIKTDGTGGMIIDSGSTFTYLEKDIINMIENELMKQTKLNMSKDDNPPYQGLNRYFNSPRDVKIIPKLVFHFSGANWDMPRENYIYVKNGKSYLAFIDNDNDPEKMSIFGNMQQQNMMVLYDLVKNSLSFKPEKCSQL